MGIRGWGENGMTKLCGSDYSSTLRPFGWRVLSLLIKNDSLLRIVGLCLLWTTSMPLIVRSLMVWSGRL